MPVRLEDRDRVVGERHLAVAAALGRSLLAVPEGAADDELASDEVDVLPLEREELADPEAGLEGDDD